VKLSLLLRTLCPAQQLWQQLHGRDDKPDTYQHGDDQAVLKKIHLPTRFISHCNAPWQKIVLREEPM
jgi:hypothetical protein